MYTFIIDQFVFDDQLQKPNLATSHKELETMKTVLLAPCGCLANIPPWLLAIATTCVSLLCVSMYVYIHMHTLHLWAQCLVPKQSMYSQWEIVKTQCSIKTKHLNDRNNPSTSLGDTRVEQWLQVVEVHTVKNYALAAGNNQLSHQKGTFITVLNYTMRLFTVMRISMGNVEGGDIILKQLNSYTKLELLVHC